MKPPFGILFFVPIFSWVTTASAADFECSPPSDVATGKSPIFAGGKALIASLSQSASQPNAGNLLQQKPIVALPRSPTNLHFAGPLEIQNPRAQILEKLKDSHRTPSLDPLERWKIEINPGKRPEGLPGGTLPKPRSSYLNINPKKWGPAQLPIDPDNAKNQNDQISLLALRDDEKLRLKNGVACSDSVKKLVETFDEFSTSAPDLGIQFAGFTAWNLKLANEWEKTATPAQKQALQNARQRHQEYAASCMEANIPVEMVPDNVRRAVGILSHEGEVECTALRISASRILTAKHCLFDPQSGKPNSILSSMEENSSKMWFSYEGEPGSRFGVCLNSAKRVYDGESIHPMQDEIVLDIAPTNSSVPYVEWAAQEVSEGTSLYLRGYSHFTNGELAPLDRLRSSSSACYAHAVGKGCFFHSCQATASMSGAPIFLRPRPGSSDDKLRLAGIHLGNSALSSSSGNFGAACDSIDGARIPAANFAIVPTVRN